MPGSDGLAFLSRHSDRQRHCWENAMEGAGQRLQSLEAEPSLIGLVRTNTLKALQPVPFDFFNEPFIVSVSDKVTSIPLDQVFA